MNKTIDWTPTEYDLKWTKNLFNSLKDGGIWKFSTGSYGMPVGSTNATFTRKGDGVRLTDIHIENMEESDILLLRIEKAKMCFQKLGIPCKTTNSANAIFVDMVSKK